MCGIVGILGREPVTAPLIDALKREERREVRLGYGDHHRRPMTECSRRPSPTCKRLWRVRARSSRSPIPRAVHMDSLSTLTLPAMPATVTPLVYAIPVTDVDQPRNFAKSVTVE